MRTTATKTIGIREIRALRRRAGTRLRDFACLLCGDPHEADEIMWRVLMELLGRHGGVRDWVDEDFSEEIVRVCLNRSGNEEVADWRDYLDRHPDKEEEEKRKKERRKMEEVVDAYFAGVDAGKRVKGSATRRARKRVSTQEAEKRSKGHEHGPKANPGGVVGRRPADWDR